MSTVLEPTPFESTGPLEPGVTLLEASAGTGKTYSISSLFVRLVVEYGFEVEQILAVTFTVAATAELTSRIRKRLGEAHAALVGAAKGRALPDDLVIQHLVAEAKRHDLEAWAERARKGVESFDRASIDTIHGFCQRMLKQNALECQVPFDVDLIEDHDQLITEVVDDFWVELVTRHSPIEILALELMEIKVSTLRELGRTAVSQWEASPTPAPAGQVSAPDSTAVDAALTHAAHIARRPEVKAQVAALAQRNNALTHYNEKDWRQVPQTLDILAQGALTKTSIERLRLLHLDRLRAELEGAPPPPIVTAITALLDAYDAWQPSARPWGQALRAAFVERVRAESFRRTSERGLWTYDDLLRRLRDAVRSPEPAIRDALQRAVGGRFKAVLIDEFQDTDPVQWDIFEALFGGGRHHLYLIGDPKQAIYGFRRADVRTYLDAAKTADRSYTLDVNYRSDTPLVDALNHLYTRASPTDAPTSTPVPTGLERTAFAHPGIPYRRVTAKYEGRVEPADPPFRVLWVNRTKANVGFPNFARSKVSGSWGERELPGVVAADIVATLSAGILIGKEGERRALRPSDLAVLVSKNAQAEKMQDALRKVGVPAVVQGPRSVFSTDEAAELLRVLRAVLDPSQLRVVRAALLTRLLGVTARELVDLESHPVSHAASDAVPTAAADRDDTRLARDDADPRTRDDASPRAASLESWFERLRQWREAWTHRSFIEAFRSIMSERVEALLALDDGERRVANFLHLGELMHRAVADRELKPQGLLAWLERQRSRSDKTDERQQIRLETDEPAVQIVTIHKSKGLEYPFVWIPFAWQESAGRFGRRADFVFRGDHDPKPFLDIDLDDRSVARESHHRIHTYAERTERLRNLYVALTRAKHRVTVVAGAFWDLPRSALGYTLLSTASASDAQSLDALTKNLEVAMKRSDDEILHNLEVVLPRHLFKLEALTVGTKKRVRMTAPPQEELEKRDWPADRKLDTWWRRTSFSGLVKGSNDDPHNAVEEQQQAASDEDKIAVDEPTSTSPPEKILLADFPGGRAIGNCLHAIFEHVDFTQPEPALLSPVVLAELTHFGVATTHEPLVTRSVADVLTTRLDPSGFRLADLPATSRLAELAFIVPVAGGYAVDGAGFSVRTLAETIARHAPPEHASWVTRLDTLSFGAVRGFLSGSIDLAFRAPHDGRWYVLDWKSNHLGPSPTDYHRPRLLTAMEHHHYHLQYLIYSVALCRFLVQRVPGFSVARDFGGVYYLFLRGMHPSHPPGTGIYDHRPTPALLADLDALFGGHTLALPPSTAPADGDRT
ncbi:MAG: exodeoxyribonuclease V subunit beta [Deltaproteobacteria bacterium]|nr:exodeoxyribonuclease V subunit beta [Deltaproteobacteria bacterium]